MSTLAAYGVASRRRRTDRAVRGLIVAATVLAMVPLALILYYLLLKGLGAISWNFSDAPTRRATRSSARRTSVGFAARSSARC